MAQLDVRPKKKGSLFIWIIFAIIAIGVVVLLYRGSNKSAPLKALYSDSTSNNYIKADTGINIQPNWNSIDFDIPKTSYKGLTNTAVAVTSNNKYAIYTVSSDSLFAPNKTTFKPSAHVILNNIVSSIHKQYKSVNLGIFSHKNLGDKQQSDKRIDAIKDWLMIVGEVPADQLSIHFFEDVKKTVQDLNKSDISIVAYTNDVK